MQIHFKANSEIGDTCPASSSLNSLFSKAYPQYVAYPWKLRFNKDCDLNKNTAPDIYVYELDADGDYVKYRNGKYKIHRCYALNGKNAIASSGAKVLQMSEMDNGDFSITLPSGSISRLKRSFAIEDQNSIVPLTATEPGGLGKYHAEIKDFSVTRINATTTIEPYDPYDENEKSIKKTNIYTVGARMEDGIALGLTKILNEDRSHPMRDGYKGDLVAMSTAQIDKKWLQEWNSKKYPSKEDPNSKFKFKNSDIVKGWQDAKGIDIVIFPARLFKNKACPFTTHNGDDNGVIDKHITVQVKMEPRALVQYGTYFIECNTQKGDGPRVDSGINKTIAKWWCFHDSAVEATLIPTNTVRELIDGKDLQHISNKEKANNEWDPMGIRLACSDVLQHQHTCSSILPNEYVEAYKKISYDLHRKTVNIDTEECFMVQDGSRDRGFEYAVGQDLTFEEKKALFEGTLKASRIRKMRA